MENAHGKITQLRVGKDLVYDIDLPEDVTPKYSKSLLIL